MAERSQYDIEFDVKFKSGLETSLAKMGDKVAHEIGRIDKAFKDSRGISDFDKNVQNTIRNITRGAAESKLPQILDNWRKTAITAFHAIDSEFKKTDTFKRMARDMRDLDDQVDSTIRKLSGVPDNFRRFGDDISKTRNEIVNLSITLKLLRGQLDSAKTFGSYFQDVDVGGIEADIKRANRELIDARRNLRYLTDRHYRIRVDITEHLQRNINNIRQGLARLGDQALILSQQMRTLYLQIGVLGRFLTLSLFVLSPLLSSLVALGGALVSVGSAAVFAGAALGGALAVGAAQALPVIGLLAAALGKLKNILNLIKQEDKASATAGAKGEDLDARRQAAQQLIIAQQNLANSVRNLAKARRDARRDLEDLIIAEKRARLEAEGAVISQIRAGQTLRAAIRGGDVLDIREAQIGVESAGLDVQASRTAQSRTSQQLTEAQKAGVAGSEKVLDAQRQLQQATYALADAQAAAAKAAQGQTAANAALAGQLAKLSPVEQKLKEAVERLQGAFRAAFNPIIDIILQSFIYISDGITKIIKDPELIDAFRDLGTGIAGALKELFDVLASPENLRLFKDIVRESGRNLPLVARAFANIMVIIGNVVRAAAPLLRPLLERFVGWLDRVKTATSDTNKLGTTFLKWGIYLKAFLDLGEALFDVLKNVMSAAAPAGLKIIGFFTQELNKLADFLKQNPERAEEFFNNMGDAALAILDVLGELGKFLAGQVEAGLVKDMAEVFLNVLLPAFENVAGVVHDFVKILLELSKTPIVGDILRIVATVQLLSIVLITVASAFRAPIALFAFFFVKNAEGLTKFGVLLKNIGEAAQKVAGWLVKLGTAFSALAKIIGVSSLTLGIWVAAIAAIVITLVILEKKFGVVSKAVEFFKDIAETVWNWIKDNWPKIIYFFPIVALVKLIHDKWGAITGFFKTSFDAIKTVFSTFWDGMKQIASDGVKLVVDTFKGLGKDLLDIGKTIITVAYTPIYYAYQAIRTAADVLPGVDTPADIPSPSELFSGPSYDTGGRGPVAGPATPARQSAAGDYVPATPGGQMHVLGEGGYPEYVLSTDPKYSNRTAMLLDKFLSERSFASGGVVKNYESLEEFWLRFTGKKWGDPSVAGLKKFAQQWYMLYREEKEAPISNTSRGTIAGAPRASAGSVPDTKVTGGLANPIPGGSWAGGPYQGSHTLGNWQSDNAYDIFGPSGAKVYAVAAGYIPRISPPGKGPRFAGQGIYLDTKKAGMWWYKHVNALVRSGQTVGAGQAIGSLVSYTAGGPHLHLARQSGNPGDARRYDMGGELPGQEGEPQLVIAHAGEMILNRVQQMKLGGVAYLRRLLGFGEDGKRSFATGGVVSPEFSAAQASITTATTTLQGLGVARGLRPSIEGLKNVFTALTASIQEGLRVMTEEISKLKDNIDKKIQTATYTVSTTASGAIQVTEAPPLDVANAKVAGVEQEIGALQQQQTTNDSVLAAAINAETMARNKLAHLRRIQKSNPKAVTPAMLKNAQQTLEVAIGFRKQAEQNKIDLGAGIADAGGRLLEAQQARRETIVSSSLDVNKAQDRLESIDKQEQIAQIQGRSTSDLINNRISVLMEQRRSLLDARFAAAGDAKLIAMIDKEVESLDVSIASATASRFEAVKNELLKPSSQALAMLGVQQSIAQISGPGFGPDRGAVESVLGSIGDALGDQRGVMEGLLAAAQAIDPATGLQVGTADQVADLKLQLAQNELALLENSKALYDLRTDIGYFLQPTNARLSILGVEQQIAQISGPNFSPDREKLIQVNQQVRKTLQEQARIMKGLLDDVRGDPVKLADLQLQLKQNELALLQNSKELQELNGQMNIQSFSSKTWEAFRLAVFTGGGKILPQFDSPAITGGAVATTSGLSTPPASTSDSGRRHRGRDYTDRGDTNIYITEPTEVADPVYMGARLSWEKKYRR